MKRNLFPFVFMFIIGIAMVGCAEPEGQDENIKATQEILELTLNGPSEELREALGSGFEATNQYDEERFRDFFANENGYIDFVNSYGAVLMLRPVKNDYTLNVHTIDVEQKDAEKYIYNFSVEVEHQKDGITEMKTVTGQANFNEAHKVEYMLIRANDL